MTVLIIAYACEPFKGSEPGVGWNWVVELSKYCNIILITRKNNKKVIDNELKLKNINNVTVHCYDIPILTSLKKVIPLGVKIYYSLWIKSIHLFLNKHRLIENIDLIHHLTMNTFQIPTKVYKYNKKTIWGPIGGGIIAPLSPFFRLGWRYGVSEIIRTVFTTMARNKREVISAISSFDKIIFANEATYIFLKKHYQNKPTILLETGISEDYIKEKEQVNNKKIRLLYAGAIIPRKGINILIDAVKKIQKDYELSIIGNGNIKKNIIKLIKKNKLEGKIKIIDGIAYTNMEKIYEEHDVFVFPSMRDTSGNVVLEAMSKGLPIIAFDHQGMKDILDEKCAIKIQIGSYKQMTNKLGEAIEYLIINPKVRVEMGKHSIIRIRDMYLWETKAKYLSKIYYELVNEDTPNT